VYAAVIVGVDGHAASRRAVRVGASLAEQVGCPLVLAHVRDPLAGEDDDRWLEELALGRGDTRVERLTGASAATSLLEYQAAHPDALLCLGTRAVPAPREVLLGSCAGEVLRGTDRPLLLVGPRCCPPDRIDAVVGAYDGTPAGSSAAHTAAMWAFLLRAQVHLVRVARPSEPGAPHDDATDLAALGRELQDHLGCSPVWDVLHSDDVATALADYGRTAGASLVVVGHTDHALPRRLLGVTAAELVRISTAPVLIARKPKEQGS
jgi:nucleotide-binding universal stress UspA family protein